MSMVDERAAFAEDRVRVVPVAEHALDPEMKEYLLGMVFPLGLFTVQEIRNRRRQAPSTP
ncbi:hypothetical protein AOZ06_24790 [Kibdelosporangium phytohabitans]|uniref:Uncharacterized protein n=2 Tax=Kibdelosporangium phytohabitans TaxID=860235 RepID=A0A0N9HWI7_9PSEU|nr:hypothetical protein AOZ06_24790 [Kibdelosporangium phytohabitans]